MLILASTLGIHSSLTPESKKEKLACSCVKKKNPLSHSSKPMGGGQAGNDGNIVT